jgi:hypothetical protein
MNPASQLLAPQNAKEITVDDLCKHLKISADIKAIPLVSSALEALKNSPLLAGGVIPKVLLLIH